MRRLTRLLADLRGRGVELAAEGDRIRFRAEKGAITQADRELIGSCRSEILALLKGGARDRTVPGPSQKSRNTPARTPRPPAESLPPSQNSHKSQMDPPARNSAICANPASRARGGKPAGRVGKASPSRRAVTISGRTFPYDFWDGQRLGGDRIGFDTETALIVEDEVPELALASASSGTGHFLIHPGRLAEFLVRHRGRRFVLFNCAFDSWVVARFLADRGEAEALAVWQGVVDDGRMHDAMLLDELIRLGRTDAYPRPRDLGEVALEYAGLEIDKNDPYRLRYGEIIGKDWSEVEEGFFTYAVKDAIATRLVYDAMTPEAVSLMEDHGLDPADAVKQFGLLSEVVQVQGAIPLAQIGFNGMNVETARLEPLREGLQRRRDELLAELERMAAWEGVVRRDRNGGVVLTPKTGAPSLDQKRLRGLLEEAAAEVERETGHKVRIPRTKTDLVSLRAEDWEELAPFSPVVSQWIELGKVTKNLQFFGILRGPVVHPKYNPLVRTGLTSCSNPNVQNLPRKGGFREAFVPSPGHLFLIVDYRFVELVTLATVCEARFGESKLAEVIRDGIDPHAHTAAMFEGVSLETFMGWKTSESEEKRKLYETLRQRAKVVNFGIPGGLGPRALVAYAKSMYNVTLTLEEAKEFRRRLIEEVYPELGLYLADDGMESLARNLGAPVGECWGRLDWKGDRSGSVSGGVRNVVTGKTRRADGGPYKARYLSGVWDGLAALNCNPGLAPLLARREGSEELARRLFHGGVTTLTGRVRGRVSFTQARNTPFQGLAADGAKLALWALVRAGYRVVAFVHDEFVIELPEDADHTAEAKAIEAIVNRSMERVTGDVPVTCEYALSPRWSKSAKAKFDENGRLIPCEIDAE